MNIAIIGTRGIPNHYGSFEQFAEYLSVSLLSHGHKVTVYNSHRHPYRENNWKGVKITHCYDPEYFLGSFGQFFYDLNCIIDCRRNQFDIILQLGYTSSSIWNFLLPRNSLVVTNMDGLEWKRSKYSFMTKRFLKYAEKLAVHYSDYFIADSIGIQKYLYSEYNIESRYIPYGADYHELPKMNLLKEYGLRKFNYDLVIARMEPENNIELILQGFLQSNMKRELVVVGSLATKLGKYITRRYKSDKIRYLGFVSGIEKLNSLRYFSNLYFHGHSVGGTNPSLLEAMASRSLICAHDNIFNKSILEEDAFYFTSAENVTSFIDSIEKDNFSTFLINNLNKIKNLYSWKIINDEYSTFFNEIFKK